MNVASLPFAAFTAVSLGLYYSLPRRMQNPFLLLASWAFYATWSPLLTLTLVATSAGTWLAAHRLRGAVRLLVGVGLNLGLLVGSRSLLPTGFATDFEPAAVWPVVGVAFLTLQGISYVVDAHRGLEPRASFVEAALYLAWFPKLTAGPIERPAAFLTQLRRPRVVDGAVVARAATLVVIGLVRKVAVADVLFTLVRRGTEQDMSFAGLLAWALVCFVALYADFAGYTDIVRGVSLLFGIELSANFDRPFLAPDVSSLWSRWHMSFTAWLREYLYFPLARVLVARLGIGDPLVLVGPPVATMVACGLWHRPTFAAAGWGLLMGLLLSLQGRLARSGAAASSAGGRGLGRIGTLAAVVLCAVPALVAVIGADVLGRLSGLGGGSMPRWACIALVAATLLVDALTSPRELEGLITPLPVATRSSLLAAALLLLALTGAVTPAFVYQGF